MGIDTRSQVRHFIEGIKITRFDVVKAQIMENASIRTDYDECVSLYNTFIDQIKKVSPPELNISGVDSYNPKGGLQKNARAVVEELLKICTIPRRNISHFLLTREHHYTRRYSPGYTSL